ncbi:MAG TPA: Ig domain-containing protein [Clostridia bacterium]|nr:Ig domain-containing protein [Clostridia bacterium]
MVLTYQRRIIVLAIVLALALTGCGGTVAEAASNSKSSTPVIATSTLPSGTQLTTYAAALQAAGGAPPYSWRLNKNSALPSGVSFDSSRGVFEGIPEQTGTFQVGVEVVDSSTRSQSKNFKLTVVQKLKLTGGALGAATANASYSATLSATGGSKPYAYALAGGTLPAGLSLGSNGTISGTPTAAGSSSFVVMATDTTSPAQSTSATYSLAVTQSVAPLAIETVSFPDAKIGTAYSATLSGTGGQLPYAWSLAAGSLPAGLSLGPDGAIKGTPTVAGSYSFTAQLTDSVSQKTTANFAIQVSTTTLQSLAITTNSVSSGTLGQPYAASLAAMGGTEPYTWKVVSGSLPGSVTLAATSGSLSGTPTIGGTSTFTVQVADANSQTASKTLSILISSDMLDQYGGLMSSSCNATGFFHTEQINGKWWFCTPEGHIWWMVAMYHVAGDSHTTDLGTSYDAVVTAKYGNKDTIWGPQTVRRLKSWGFNSVAEFSVSWVTPIQTCGWAPSCPGGWGENGGKQPAPVPMLTMVQPSMYSLFNSRNYAPGPVKDIQSGITPSYYGAGWNSTFPDIWDTNYYAWLDGELQNNSSIKAAQNSPWVVGWISDECDSLFGLCGAGPDMATIPQGHNQRHQGLMTLVTSPVQNANPGRAMVSSPQVYAEQDVFSKTQLKLFLQGRYSSIAALNNAWSSNYSQWDSTGTQVNGEILGKGDGVTKTFTKTLANINIAALSVGVRVSGTKVGGDCPKWLCGAATTGHGLFTGPTSTQPNAIAGGDINYSNGAITVSFATAPANGEIISVDYVRDGWGYGSGLMDEDGRHSWIPTDKVYLGTNTSFNADMDAFLKALADTYFSVTSERIKHYAPNNLYLGPGVMGTWGGVANKNVLEAAASYVDVLTWQPDYARLSAEVEYVATHLGDKPVILWHGAKSTADSALWRYTNPTDTECNPCNTQEERGKFYFDSMSTFLATKNTSFDSRTVIGIRWWEFHDNWLEGNWGLVSLQDNAYDGVENCSVSTTDAFGYKTFAEENVPSWQAATIYKVASGVPSSGVKGNRIQAVVSDGKRYLYQASVSGTSGTVQPAWPTVEGATVTDGTVTWKNVGLKTSSTCYGDMLTQVKKANALWRQLQ